MKKLTAVVAVGTTITLLAGCTTGSTGGNGETQAQGADGPPALELASSEVISDSDGSGIEASQRLFENSETVVVAGPTPEDQLRAASIAVAAGAPMLSADAGGSALAEEIERLGAARVVTVGEVGDVATLGEEGDVEIVDGAATDREVEIRPVNSEAEIAAAVAGLDASEPRLLTAGWGQAPAPAAGLPEAEHTEHPLQMPPMLATAETGAAAVATARAAGADVTVLEVADPRISSESMELVSDQDVLALGQQFGTDEEFAEVVDLADNGELPGGGGLVFPGRRMIAFYGHPSGPALGVMGEQPPAEAVARVQEHVANYQALVDEPVIPAFEIIATVASEFPGEDGNYSNEFSVEDLRPYVDAIIDAGGYAVLDLQPGQASFLEQAKLYEELLLHPNVGLALDPEWNLQPGEQPMQRIGHAEAHEVNEVSEWLANLVRENDLPQKALVLHQFQLQMLRDREQINTDHPELSFVLHADGNGAPEQKFDTWNVMRQGLDEDAYFMAWKNFIDEDSPMFTPEQTYDVEPRPWFVSYQ